MVKNVFYGLFCKILIIGCVYFLFKIIQGNVLYGSMKICGARKILVLVLWTKKIPNLVPKSDPVVFRDIFGYTLLLVLKVYIFSCDLEWSEVVVYQISDILTKGFWCYDQKSPKFGLNLGDGHVCGHF